MSFGETALQFVELGRRETSPVPLLFHRRGRHGAGRRAHHCVAVILQMMLDALMLARMLVRAKTVVAFVTAG